jgi:magnesium chelatase family protein
VALVGGGYPQPGEISMAHNGVLFLDELPEFKRDVLEVMRQPLEDKKSQYQERNLRSLILRHSCCSQYESESEWFFNDPDSPQTSSPHEMQRYLSKISGPLLDRIDIHQVTPVPLKKLSDDRQKRRHKRKE